MNDFFDQVFVLLKHWVVGFFPPMGQPFVSALLSVGAIMVVFALLFGITTVIERKMIGRVQNRYGPNRVGLPFTGLRIYGFGQFIADGIKALTKEDVVPRAADKTVHFLAPVVLMVPVFLAYAVVPVGRNMAPIDIDAGVLFFFAVGAATELSVFMAGWSSRNKYSLLGAMRGIAQMISYEVPLIISAVTVVMMVGSLSTVKIVEAQAEYSGQWPHWHVFTPWGFAGLGLFLSGWTAPLAFLAWLPSWLWFFAKLVAFLLFFIWVRGTLPRLRMDQLMNFAWKFMLPMALINIVAAGLWSLLSPGFGRWAVCSLLLVVPYVLLGRGLAGRKLLAKRTYRYAE